MRVDSLKSRNCGCSETHGEFYYGINPSWSCAHFEAGTGFVRIRAKKENFPDRAAQKKCVEQTIGMFVFFLDAINKAKAHLEELLITIGKQFSHTSIEE